MGELCSCGKDPHRHDGRMEDREEGDVRDTQGFVRRSKKEPSGGGRMKSVDDYLVISSDVIWNQEPERGATKDGNKFRITH